MNNTFQLLLLWDKGQPFSERLAGKILDLEGYTSIDPQSPMGGRDGAKDLLCIKDRRRLVVGCYFPYGQQTEKEIASKFAKDYVGVARNGADGFVFVTNQKLTPGERLALIESYPCSEIYHGERVCGVLDSPKGYGVRLEYLGIELSKAEQISFLNAHLDLKEQFEDIRRSLEAIRQVTVQIAGEVQPRDRVQVPTFATPPVAGVKLSGRLSVEDLFAIHLACLYDVPLPHVQPLLGFRKTDVWIGAPGSTKESAEFVPPTSAEVPRLTAELLAWWRTEHTNVCYADPPAKVAAIATFHARFLSIHPFLDGNGRVARVIASIQYADLLSKDIRFDGIDDPGRYYSALRSARDGKHQALVDIFLTLAG